MSKVETRFGNIAFKGAVVTGVGQAIKVALRMVQIVVLARLLTPEDLGLVAAVAPLITFVTLFQNLGLQQAVVQRKTIEDRQINQIFWIMAFVGVFSMALVVCASPAIAYFYDDPRMTGIAEVASVPLLFGSLTALPLGLVNRQMHFGALIFNEVWGALTLLVVSVGSAFLGAGYWSLLIGSAASAFVMMLTAWAYAGWRPSRPDFRIDREIFFFGANLTSTNMLNFFARNLDNILIGKYVGVSALGYYDRAYKLLLFPLQAINLPLGRVVIPILSRMQGDLPRIREAYMKSVSVIGLTIIPGIVALAISSNETIKLLFGERWMAAAPIFSWLGVVCVFQPIGNTVGWLFIALGKGKQQLVMAVGTAIATSVAFIIGLRWGAEGVAAGYALALVGLLPLRWWYMSKVTPLSFGDWWSLYSPYFLSSGITFIIVTHSLSLLVLNDLAQLMCSVAVSYVVACTVLSMTSRGRQSLRVIFNIVGRALRYRSAN